MVLGFLCFLICFYETSTGCIQFYTQTVLRKTTFIILAKKFHFSDYQRNNQMQKGSITASWVRAVRIFKILMFNINYIFFGEMSI